MSESGNGRYKPRRKATRAASRSSRSGNRSTPPAETTPPTRPEPPRYAPRNSDESPFWASAQSRPATPQYAPRGALPTYTPRDSNSQGLGTARPAGGSPSWVAQPLSGTESASRGAAEEPRTSGLGETAGAWSSRRAADPRLGSIADDWASLGDAAAARTEPAGSTTADGLGGATTPPADSLNSPTGTPAAEGLGTTGLAADGFGTSTRAAADDWATLGGDIGSPPSKPATPTDTRGGSAGAAAHGFGGSAGAASDGLGGSARADGTGEAAGYGAARGDDPHAWRTAAGVAAGGAALRGRDGGAGGVQEVAGGPRSSSGRGSAGRASGGAGVAGGGSGGRGGRAARGGKEGRGKRVLIAIASVVVVITPISWILLHQPQNDEADASEPMVTRTDDTYITPTTKPVVAPPSTRASTPPPTATPTRTPSPSVTPTTAPTDPGSPDPTDDPTTTPTDGRMTTAPTNPTTPGRTATTEGPKPTTSPTSPPPPPPPVDGDMNSEEQKLFDLIDSARVSNGCAHLKQDPNLTHSAESTAEDRAESGDNLSSGSGSQAGAGGDGMTARQAYNQMMDNQRSTILNCGLTTLGVGRDTSKHCSGLGCLLGIEHTRVAWVANFS